MSEDEAYGGARVLVELHAEHLRRFLDIWRRADSVGVTLPESSSPNYASRDALLAHVLGCAARYLSWICEQLDLESPELEEWPEVEGLAARAEEYLEAVLGAWEAPLLGVTEKQAYAETYPSRWGTPYCIDAMLEHAVMHPIRHARQLEELMRKS